MKNYRRTKETKDIKRTQQKEKGNNRSKKAIIYVEKETLEVKKTIEEKRNYIIKKETIEIKRKQQK